MELPIELNFKIFEYLEMADILKLRLVCKQFKLIIQNMRFDELIFVSDDCPIEGNWFYSNRPFNLNNLIDSSKLSILKTSFISTEFTLKRLKIVCGGEDFQLSLNDLNKFKNLVNLELYIVTSIKPESVDEIVLYLPKLETLFLYNNLLLKLTNLILKTPKLKAFKFKIFEGFKYNWTKFISFDYPLSISYLHINYFQQFFTIFKNVDHLVCKNLYSNQIFDCFPKLKQLEINFGYKIDQELIERSDDIKIYVAGQQITNKRIK